MERSVVVVDIDHTLADSAWRDCLMPLDHMNGDWTTYYSCQDQDRPRMETVTYVRGLALGFDIVVVTARSELYRDVTENWLRRHDIPHSELLMRPIGDKTKSPELKLAMVAHLLPRVRAVIDDRDDVLAAFEARGVETLKSNGNRNPELMPP